MLRNENLNFSQIKIDVEKYKENYNKWRKEQKSPMVFRKFVYRPQTLLQRSIEGYNQAPTKPNLFSA